MPLSPDFLVTQQYPSCGTLPFCDETGEYDATTNPGGFGGGGNPAVGDIVQTKFVLTAPGSDVSVPVDLGFLASGCTNITFADYAMNAPEICAYDIEFATFGLATSILINNVSISLGTPANITALLASLNSKNKGVWSITGDTTIEVVGGYQYSDLSIGANIYHPACPPADDPCNTCGENAPPSSMAADVSTFSDGCWQLTYQLYTNQSTGVYDLSGAAYGGVFTISIFGKSYSLGTIASEALLLDALNGLGMGTWTLDASIFTVVGNYSYMNIVGAATFTPEITVDGTALFAEVTKNIFLSCNITGNLANLMLQAMKAGRCDCNDKQNVDYLLTRIRTDYETMLLVANTNACNCDCAGAWLDKINKAITWAVANCT